MTVSFLVVLNKKCLAREDTRSQLIHELLFRYDLFANVLHAFDSLILRSSRKQTGGSFII